MQLHADGLGPMRVPNAASGERTRVVWSAIQFGCVLASLALVRPYRDELGIESGVDNLQWLFSGTFFAVLLVLPVYAFGVSRLGRRSFLAATYAVVAVSLTLCFAGMHFASPAVRPGLAAGCFVWLSAVNLIVVSAFWSAMSDVYSTQQGETNFGPIASGGSLGAIGGPLAATLLVERFDPVWLLVVSATIMLLAAACAARLERLLPPERQRAPVIRPGVLRGFSLAWREPQLRRIGGYLLIMTWVSTIFYFEQAHIVRDALPDRAARTALFARMDLGVNVLAFSGQLVVTSRLIRRLGVGPVLVSLPLVSALALGLLGLLPGLDVLVACQVTRRATNFALAKPAREALFTAMSREARFKGKSVADTALYRGGDALAGWVFAGLQGVGVPLSTIAWLGLPVVAAWGALGFSLGRAHGRGQQPPASELRGRTPK